MTSFELTANFLVLGGGSQPQGGSITTPSPARETKTNQPALTSTVVETPQETPKTVELTHSDDNTATTPEVYLDNIGSTAAEITNVVNDLSKTSATVVVHGDTEGKEVDHDQYETTSSVYSDVGHNRSETTVNMVTEDDDGLFKISAKATNDDLSKTTTTAFVVTNDDHEFSETTAAAALITNAVHNFYSTTKLVAAEVDHDLSPTTTAVNADVYSYIPIATTPQDTDIALDLLKSTALVAAEVDHDLSATTTAVNTDVYSYISLATTPQVTDFGLDLLKTTAIVDSSTTAAGDTEDDYNVSETTATTGGNNDESSEWGSGSAFDYDQIVPVTSGTLTILTMIK
jgi:hypothetical protein